MNNKVNSLSQFIGQYDSDSDNEEEEKETDAQKCNNKKYLNTSWTKCFAKDTGHPYYWNTTTREVTWEVPEEYNNYLTHIRNNLKLNNLENNMNCWVECSSKENDEVYYINKTTRILSWDKPEGFISKSNSKKLDLKNEKIKKTKPAKTFKAEEIDEKIELISYYSETSGSSSDEEEARDECENNVLKTKELTPNSNNLDTGNILVPQHNEVEEKPEEDISIKRVSKKYGPLFPSIIKTGPYQPILFNQKIYSLKDDLSADELKTDTDIKEILESNQKIPQTENISQHESEIQSLENDKPLLVEDHHEVFDTKLFKRKKRIEVLPKSKPCNLVEITENIDDNNTRNLECSSSLGQDSKINLCPQFVKENSETNSLNIENSDDLDNSTMEEKLKIKGFGIGEFGNDIKELGDIMKHKLKFLSESTSPATSAQIMFIQFETLMAAYETKNLNEIYLLKWLTNTNSTLEKLEKEAVPDGWRCEWDRSNSRYFYENLITNKKQWEFPVEENVISDKMDKTTNNNNDEMDICTTPPPPIEFEINDLPLNDEPLESLNDKPRTPPPPIISSDFNLFQHKTNDTFGSELESFYSDIASLEPSVTTCETIQPEPSLMDTKTGNKREGSQIGDLINPPVKKKSKKVKVKGKGINSKIQDISGMVAKWQKVQKDFSH